MFSFFKKKQAPPPVHSPRTQNPTLIAAVNEEGNVFLELDCPKPTNQEEMNGLVERTAGMLLLLNDGHTFHMMQQAVGGMAERLEMPWFGQAIIKQMNEFAANRLRRDLEPMVDPMTVFEVPHDRS